MKKATVLLLTLFLLAGCAPQAINAASRDLQPAGQVNPAAIEPALAEDKTIQEITIQVIYREPEDGKLVLPVTVIGLDDSTPWAPGEPVLTLDGQAIPVDEVKPVSQAPSTDGGVFLMSNRVELHYALAPDFDPGQAAVRLEIPYVYAESQGQTAERQIIEGPWVFDLPLGGE